MGEYFNKHWEDIILKAMGDSPLRAIHLSDNKRYLFLETEDGMFHAFHTDGDCCSSSWIEHIGIHGDIFGKKIKDIVGRRIGSFDKNPEKYCENALIQDYSAVFQGEIGYLEIEYRNESNGYYGGSLEYLGSKTATPPQLTLKLITEDF